MLHREKRRVKYVTVWRPRGAKFAHQSKPEAVGICKACESVQGARVNGAR